MSLSLLDWRRRVTCLYADIRASNDVRAAHEQWRTTRDALFRDHPESPLSRDARKRFTGLPVADYDSDLRYEAVVDTDVAPLRVEVPTGTDGIVVFERIGRVYLGGLGQLDVLWLVSYGGGVFVPVKDALAGTGTYGGGRYLIDTVKGADLSGGDGWLVIDFNFAYNPSCAYDLTWACPLAPPGNTLPGPVRAGELMAK